MQLSSFHGSSCPNVIQRPHRVDMILNASVHLSVPLFLSLAALARALAWLANKAQQIDLSFHPIAPRVLARKARQNWGIHPTANTPFKLTRIEVKHHAR
jgi:hypothetical protein